MNKVTMTNSIGHIKDDEMRFEFGKNWRAFIKLLDENRIDIAKKSLVEMLGLSNLEGKTFLDVGSGSGLFSLAAAQLGASVHSFDYDTVSVDCTRRLRTNFGFSDENWTIEQGSVLDGNYVGALGKSDIVYSWGVLHHTGDMWAALKNAIDLVNEDGYLYIALYNDEGKKSQRWLKTKRLYNKNTFGKLLVCSRFIPFWAGKVALRSIKRRKNFFRTPKGRGMSLFRDWFDWLGGLPFEVAKPEDVLKFCINLGFYLENLTTTNKLDCNEFVFRKDVKKKTR